MCWLLNKSKVSKEQFIRNYINQIWSLIDQAKWGYCPSAENPADIASRGSSSSKLAEKSIWWEGPKFLSKSPEHWPKFDLIEQAEPKIENFQTQSVLISSNQSSIELNKIIQSQNFSNVDKLFRVTTLVLKFVQILKGKNNSSENSELSYQQLYERSKNLWYKEIQKSSMNDVRKVSSVSSNLL